MVADGPGSTVGDGVVIRDAGPADVQGIAAIYDHEVRSGTATFDTEPPPSQHWLDKLARTGPGDHFLVAAGDGAVRGYAHSGEFRARPAYGRTREVSVYVAPDAAGRGLGRRLYDVLLDRLRGDGVHLVVAGTALPNPASEALHRACGFEPVGVFREVGRKFDTWVDVAWWQLRL